MWLLKVNIIKLLEIEGKFFNMRKSFNEKLTAYIILTESFHLKIKNKK